MKMRLLVVGLAVVLSGCGSSGHSGASTPTSSATVSTLSLQAPSSQAMSARCMAPNVSTLKQATHAFDGRVSAIDGDKVTLQVTKWYAGGGGTQVVVTAPTADMHALIDAVLFKTGQRFLVASDDHDRLLVCGYSSAWSAHLEDLYKTAFPAL